MTRPKDETSDGVRFFGSSLVQKLGEGRWARRRQPAEGHHLNATCDVLKLEGNTRGVKLLWARFRSNCPYTPVVLIFYCLRSFNAYFLSRIRCIIL